MPIMNSNNQLELASSTLLEDAELALENLKRQEIQLIKETEELFKGQVDYIKQIDRIKNFVPNMQVIDADTKKLSSIVESSSTLVEDVCSKVRRIDLAKARLDNCLSRIGDVLDLKSCRNGLNEAMKHDNYEEAAMHIKRYLSIDQTELHKTIGMLCEGISSMTLAKTLFSDIKESKKEDDDYSVDPNSINTAIEELNKSKIVLIRLCRDNLVKAIREDNTKDIDRFFKIFPMLNEHDEGLQRYAEYLQSKMVDSLVDEKFKSEQVNQADKLAALFESIAKLIDSHQPLVETYYGPGHLIAIVKVMQKECDRLCRKILEEFRDVTKLQHVAKLVKNSSLQAPPQLTPLYNSQNPAIYVAPSRLDPRDIDKILNEISTIISRSEVYLNFIVQRVKEDINSKAENESQKQASFLELYNLVCIECELNHLIQEVGGIYVLFEQFYLNESSKKAIIMDQIDTESSSCFVSSMLDDIFFIIKKCTKRAISTKSNEVFCAIINHCVTLLESTFCRVLDDKLKNQQYYSTALTGKNFDLSQAYSAIKSGRYLQSSSEYEIAKAQYFSAVNNLDKACDYVQTLRKILDVDIKKLKPSISVLEHKQDNQIEKSLTCLNELSQLINKFSSVANSSLYQLFNATLRNRLRTELKTIMNEDPELVNDLEQVNELSKTLLLRLDKSLQDSLTVENYSKLISITKDFLTSSIKTTNQ